MTPFPFADIRTVGKSASVAAFVVIVVASLMAPAGSAAAQEAEPPPTVGTGASGQRTTSRVVNEQPERVDKISPELARRIDEASEPNLLPIVIHLTGAADLSAIAAGNDADSGSRSAGGAARRRPRLNRTAEAVVVGLIDENKKQRRDVVDLLDAQQGQGKAGPIEPLWIINGLATDATPEVIQELAKRRDVGSIEYDGPVASSQAHGGAVEPNIETVGAHSYWDLGYTGTGVVTGFIDSGADLGAGELGDTWRGGPNSWLDLVDASPTPLDPLDSFGTPHGTVALGVAHGDDRGGAALGVAPGAEWIAARVFNQQRQATASDIHLAFQWMLDPDGNPATDDAPRVVNNSWVISSGTCSLEFEPDIQALVAAGILPVFAAGNQGVTSGGASPGNYLDALAVGAVDNNDLLWNNMPFGASNQGPTDCGTPGQSRTFPDLTAPGQDIKTVEGFQFYFQRSGTSISAPHVTGAAALLLSEFPGLTVSELRAALEAGAVDLGPNGPDDAYGSGRLDVIAARAILAKASIGDFVWSDLNANGAFDAGEPALEGVTVRLIGPGPDETFGTTDDVVLDTDTTDIVGHYLLEGLDGGEYRVDIDDSTVTAGSILTTGNDPIDITMAAGEVRNDVDFGFAPPPPSTVSGQIRNDIDGDGNLESGEPGIADVRVVLVGPGVDGTLGTVDDEVLADAFSTSAGDYSIDDIAAGNYLVQVEVASLPAGATVTTGGESTQLTVGVGQSITGIDFGYSIDAQAETIYLSLSTNGALVGGGLPYSDEDILAWTGTTMSMFFDGSDLGLQANDIDAIQVVDSTQVAFSLQNDMSLPDLGAVDNSDVLLFSGTTGPATSGTLEVYFDASDVGLSTGAENVDGFDILGDGTLLVSTLGNPSVPGLSGLADEDVLAFTPSSLGANTAGQWALWHDGSDVGLTNSGEDLDAIDSAGADLIVSTHGELNVSGAQGADHDLALCSSWVPGAASECQWSILLDGASIGLRTGADIDAVTVRSDVPTSDDGSFTASFGLDRTVNDGTLQVDDLDVVHWNGSAFEMLFDASDLGLVDGDIDGVHHVDANTLLLSFTNFVSIDGLAIDDADIVTFTGQLGADTSGTFTRYLDGSDVGLFGNSGDIDAFTVLDDGGIVISITGDRKIRNIRYDDADLLLLTPTSLGANSAGTWSLYLDAGAQGLDDVSAKDIDAVEIDDTTAPWVSIRGAATLGGTAVARRDMASCSGLTSPSTPCSWAIAVAGASLGLTGNDIDGFSSPPAAP